MKPQNHKKLLDWLRCDILGWHAPAYDEELRICSYVCKYCGLPLIGYDGNWF